MSEGGDAPGIAAGQRQTELLLAALGTILLSGVLILYWLYDKIVGIDNMKLG